ncbi:coiled-coil domain-containing protein 22-like [Salvia splendens]|uniref:coiled-coil domain-containing protein 22-like n=1 Tax=Salvia splendens TaxID=180675 RepID=UPI001C2685E5|nr:coiled-coil domain-containing protein 22-like [Salvia splendens]
MEASEEILLNSLANSGVPIPLGCSSVGDLTPPSLFSLCSAALRLIDGQRYVSAFPPCLPEDSILDRLKICSELAHAFNELGYSPDLSFHKFLYPSEEDSYNLVRFLVAKISESSGARTAPLRDGGNELGDEGDTVQIEEILDGFNSALHNVKLEDKETNAKGDWYPCISEGVESSRSNGQKNSQHLDEELQLLKAAAEMVCDGQHPVEFYIDQLNEQVETKRHKLKELESEWKATEGPLLEKKRNLEQSLFSLYPEASGKLVKMKMETESVLAEIKTREEELSKLSQDLKKQPKLPPRRPYIERVTEITRNSRKQDNDIQRILKDTRELQLESNTIQERLNRTYAVVNETVFREAKKDRVARQAHRLLTDIHGSFEQIAEKVLATDRTCREAADYEAKLATLHGRSTNMSKLQEDLDAIRKENELLEQRLHQQ